MSELPLVDITVLEMGSSVAGPFATRILADMGARVIKVEPPDTGDPSRIWGDEKLGGTGYTFQAFNKDKLSVVVDFNDADALARLKALIRDGVDIVSQNLRPGVVERYGLDAAAMTAANPALIYCNIGAYGDAGPLSGLPGYDPLIQAFGGIVDVTGEPGGRPVRAGVPIIDLGTGMWTAIGALSALHRRDMTGKGAVVGAAMLDTALAWQSLRVAMIEAGAPAPKRTGLKGPMLAPNDAYETADGLLLITVGTDRQFRRLGEAIGLPELADDPLFADNEARHGHESDLKSVLNTALGAQDRSHWMEKLNNVDVPCAPILTVEELIEHPQTLANDIVQQSPDGAFRVVGLPLTFDGERPAFRRNAPDLGAHTDDVLKEDG
jgi:crotonobetainyl-CoA:carnitine CoA-transferase CaiB-like acyl-CoA transferase